MFHRKVKKVLGREMGLNYGQKANLRETERGLSLNDAVGMGLLEGFHRCV